MTCWNGKVAYKPAKARLDEFLTQLGLVKKHNRDVFDVEQELPLPPRPADEARGRCPKCAYEFPGVKSLTWLTTEDLR
jgi:hypothetical protein